MAGPGLNNRYKVGAMNGWTRAEQWIRVGE